MYLPPDKKPNSKPLSRLQDYMTKNHVPTSPHQNKDSDESYQRRRKNLLSKFQKKIPKNCSTSQDSPTGLFRYDREDKQFTETKKEFLKNWENLEDDKMRVKLIIKCPGCEKKSKPTPWQHRTCGTSIYIEETGFLSCEDGCKKFFIQQAKFYCNKDHGVEYTQYTDLSDLLQAYMHGIESIKNSIVDQSKIQQFITILMVNISNNWDKWK
jgi:hypothetical protein